MVNIKITLFWDVLLKLVDMYQHFREVGCHNLLGWLWKCRQSSSWLLVPIFHITNGINFKKTVILNCLVSF